MANKKASTPQLSASSISEQAMDWVKSNKNHSALVLLRKASNRCYLYLYSLSRLLTCYYEPIRLAVRATNNPLHVQWAADLYRGKQVIHFNQTQMNTLFPKTRFNHGISRNNRF